MGQQATVTEFTHLRIFREEVSADDFREIVKQAVVAAKKGDADSRAWIAMYAMGKLNE